MIRLAVAIATAATATVGVALRAQVEPTRAAAFFAEASEACSREGGHLWGISLCGPMVIADAATHTIATNQPMPGDPPPPVLGLANTALVWGGTRWSTVTWSALSADTINAHARTRVMLHELFHRVQPQLGLLGPEGQNPHLDTLEGRYWLQLEWRALSRALRTSGASRVSAVADALSFRAQRRSLFIGASESERRLEINEGLAQYTGTIAASATAAEAVSDAIEQLAAAPVRNATLIRTFPYPSGTAYGLLLDEAQPHWRRTVTAQDDLGRLIEASLNVHASANPEADATKYAAAALWASEQQRDIEQRRRVADLRRRFVDEPVLTLPNGRTNTFVTSGMTPVPGVGTLYPSFHTTGDWGRLDAEEVVLTTNSQTIILPAPANVSGNTIAGTRWTLKVADGWTIQPGPRPGDFQLIRIPKTLENPPS